MTGSKRKRSSKKLDTTEASAEPVEGSQNSGKRRNKGTEEFEQQMAMAMAATAFESRGNAAIRQGKMPGVNGMGCWQIAGNI